MTAVYHFLSNCVLMKAAPPPISHEYFHHRVAVRQAYNTLAFLAPSSLPYHFIQHTPSPYHPLSAFAVAVLILSFSFLATFLEELIVK
jgi:hypothetical protein